MSNLFALIFNDSQINNAELTKLLNTRLEISFWFAQMPGTVFIKSPLTPKELSIMFEQEFGILTHLIIRIYKNQGTDYWGRLSKELWDNFK